jgi:membrane protease YdiL (CAAX protease family)
LEATVKKFRPVQEAAVFFGLTLGLSYLVFWGPLALFQIPTISFVSSMKGPTWAILLYILGGFVPSLVALALTWAKDGRAGLVKLGRRALQFNVGWRWYLVMLGIVVIGSVGQILIIWLLGGDFNYGLFVAQLGSLIPLIVLGPLSEEFGWRGYALDRLQARWDPLISSAIVGVLWGLWHGPLFAMPGTSQHELAVPFVGFVLRLVALSLIFTWLQNSTKGSLLPALFFHWVYTYAGQVISSGVTRTPLYNWLENVPYIVLAIVVVAIWRPWELRRTKPLPA